MQQRKDEADSLTKKLNIIILLTGPNKSITKQELMKEMKYSIFQEVKLRSFPTNQ
jgi:hypothetical protein